MAESKNNDKCQEKAIGGISPEEGALPISYCSQVGSNGTVLVVSKQEQFLSGKGMEKEAWQ